MANTHTLTVSGNIASGSSTLAAIAISYTATQSDTDGKFNIATLKTSTSGTAVEIPKGSCTFGSCFVIVQNLSVTTGEDIILCNDSGETHEVARLKPGSGTMLGACFVGVRNATLYAYSASGTPTLKAFYAQV